MPEKKRCEGCGKWDTERQNVNVGTCEVDKSATTNYHFCDFPDQFSPKEIPQKPSAEVGQE